MPKMQSAPLEVVKNVGVLNEKQRRGRAINAVAELLMRTLLVPKIFLLAKSPKLYLRPKLDPKEIPFVDVLAIDRAGSGDIYAVDCFLDPINKGNRETERLLSEFATLLTEYQPAHFYYIAVASESLDSISKQQLFAKDGIGRVGVIEITGDPSEPPRARIAIQAERFRVAPRWIEVIDKFQKKNPADMEFRG